MHVLIYINKLVALETIQSYNTTIKVAMQAKLLLRNIQITGIISVGEQVKVHTHIHTCMLCLIRLAKASPVCGGHCKYVC